RLRQPRSPALDGPRPDGRLAGVRGAEPRDTDVRDLCNGDLPGSASTKEGAMGKALRSAGWALLTAGSLVVAGPAVAQRVRPVSTHSCSLNCPAGCERPALNPAQA